MPTGLPVAEAMLTGLPVAEAVPTELPVAEAMPTGLPVAEAMPTGLPVAEAMPTGLPVAEAMPTELPRPALELAAARSGRDRAVGAVRPRAKRRGWRFARERWAGSASAASEVPNPSQCGP
jgi:hypothetical protein